MVYAARHYEVEALGVTLARRQVERAQRAIADAGLSGRAEVRLLDFRDVPEDDFDAISSIGLTEHVRQAQLPAYFALLRGEGGCSTTASPAPATAIPSCFATASSTATSSPTTSWSAPATVISTMHDAGFELRHEENPREHYARTLAAWEDNLEAHWSEAAAELGETRARVRRLYLAGARVSQTRTGCSRTRCSP